MATLDRDALDPEIRAAVQDIPNFVFSLETVPTMRQTAVFSPADAPDIQRIELSAGSDGGSTPSGRLAQEGSTISPTPTGPTPSSKG